jgi:hypothetical protein
MAKIDKYTTNNNRGSNAQPIGTMPKDKLTRFKLKGNIDNPGDYKHRSMADVKLVARSARAIKTYRMYVHNCVEPRLPSSLRRSVHYFMTPMSKYDGGATEAKSNNVSNNNATDNHEYDNSGTS